ncbi:MAG: class I SAM-dependent methyltransferase [Methanobacteriaceae archaeon]|nr:class I SAM-dependent methyltransferase [Methanobacteriaceae archaeon]
MVQKHIHHGKSSRKHLDTEEVLSKIGLLRGDIFLDAGCGDGYFSIAASSKVEDSGKIYAIDIYKDSINHLKNEIQNNSIINIEPIVADITTKIPLPDESVDKCLMANVMHGFDKEQELDNVMSEISRVIKSGGNFFVVEFKKIKGTPGPPLDVRLNGTDIKDIVINYGFSFESSHNVGKYHLLVKFLRK